MLTKHLVPTSYAAHRENIRSGDLLAWSENKQSFISNCILNVIKFATQSEFAHVGIAIRLCGRLFVVEATIPSVRLVPVSESESFYHIPMKVKWQMNFAWIMLSYLGLGYSLADCVRAYFGNTVKKDNVYQCVELAREIFLKFGIDLGENYTPATLVAAALKLRKTEIHYVHQMVD